MPAIAYGEIPIYGEWFLCKLYEMAQGIIERRFDRTEVFDALGKNTFEIRQNAKPLMILYNLLKKRSG